MPKLLSTASPNNPKNSRIPPPIREPLSAMARRSLALFAWVRAAKITATSGGPTVAKKVVKERRAASNIFMPWRVFRRRRTWGSVAARAGSVHPRRPWCQTWGRPFDGPVDGPFEGRDACAAHS